MAIVSKLLGIWLAGRTVTSTTPLFMRLLAAVAAVAVLSAMASALLALLFAGILWLIYGELIAHGLAPQMALVSMIGLVLMALSIMVYFVQRYVSQIRLLSNRVIVGQSPVTGGLGAVADAFMQGLNRRTTAYYK